MTEYNAKAAIMVAASPVICHDTFAKPERLTRFWFPRVSGPIRPGADLEWYMGEEKDAQCIPVTIDDAFPSLKTVATLPSIHAITVAGAVRSFHPLPGHLVLNDGRF